MDKTKTFLTLLAVLVLAFAVGRWSGPGAAPAKETAFDHMIRTNTLRCGYYLYPPFVMQDQATKKLSGIAVDMMDYVAEKTGVRVEWTEEVSFGNWVQALQAGRFDAVCAPMWPEPAKNRVALFTRPLLYAGIYPLARANDTRFSGQLSEIDKPEIRIAVQEGNVTNALAHAWFPHATFKEQPAGIDYGQLVQDMTDNKADVVLWDLNGLAQYAKHNPGKVQKIHLAKPLKVMPFELVTRVGEPALRDFLDASLDDCVNTGAWDRIMDKWEDTPGAFMRLAFPYQLTP